MANMAAEDHIRNRGITLLFKPLFKAIPTKIMHKALQNIILVMAAIETFMGFGTGEIKMKAEAKHRAMFCAMSRQADRLVKVS